MNAIEFDPLDVKKVSESQKCAQSVLNRNERHTFMPRGTLLDSLHLLDPVYMEWGTPV